MRFERGFSMHFIWYLVTESWWPNWNSYLAYQR